MKVGRIIIGRTSDNDLQVDSRFVSRHHCQIITGAEGSVIEDLNSTNGIFVQGKRVRRYNLNDGDIVVIGKHEIMYVDERLARARLNSTDGRGRADAARAGRDHSHTETAVDRRHAATTSRHRSCEPPPVAPGSSGYGTSLRGGGGGGRLIQRIRGVILGAQATIATPPQQHHHARHEHAAVPAVPGPGSNLKRSGNSSR